MILVTLALSVLLDLILGEPPSRFHPVVWIGHYLRLAHSRWRATKAWAQWLEGGLGWSFGAIAVLSIGLILERILHALPLALEVMLTAIVLKPLFAVRELFEAVGRVLGSLEAGDLEGARRSLGTHLVSRPTSDLRHDEIAGASIESLFENLSDSVIAPMLAFLVGGLPLALLYRYANTADAMWGYRTPELEYRGKIAARLDDALNLIPARVTGVLIVLASALDTRTPSSTRSRERVLDGTLTRISRSWRLMWRDAGLSASPNAGVPMSAAAGALDVRLEKRQHYALNPDARVPDATDVVRAVRLARITLFIGAAIGAGMVNLIHA